MNDLLTEIVGLLTPIQVTYSIQAPPEAQLPYFVVTLAGGPISYAFDDENIQRHRIQLTQWYKKEELLSTMVSDNATIVSALDRKKLGGIITMRLGAPLYRAVEGLSGRIMQVVQDWEWAQHEVL